MTTQNKTIPTLRFPEYNDEWEETSLNGFLIPTLREVDKPKEPYLAIGIRSHCKGTFQRPDSEPEKIAMDKLYVVKENDLIVNITFAWEGAIAIVKKDDEGGLVSHRFPTYTFDENVSSHNFFQYVFTQKKFIANLDLISPGGAGRNRVLSKKDFLKIKVNLPTFPEQQKIAAFLMAIDKKVQQLSKKKVLLEQYKKGAVQKIFNQKIRFKDLNGNDFSDWEEKKLGEVAKFSKGKGISKSDISESGNLECIRYGQLYTHYKETIREVISRTNMDASKLVLSEYNDVIIPASGESQLDIATASCVLKTGVALGGDLNIIKSKMNGVFLSYYLNNKKKLDIANLAQGISVVHLYPRQLATLRIDVPHIEEQNKIANFLSAIDEKINLVEQQLEKTQTFKKGLLQQMFV